MFPSQELCSVVDVIICILRVSKQRHNYNVKWVVLTQLIWIKICITPKMVLLRFGIVKEWINEEDELKVIQDLEEEK